MKVMAIAPYEGLKELMIDIGRNEEFELQAEVGDLEKGVSLAKEALLNDIDVIISRGGTAEMIQKVVPIPVIEIEISGYDMLRVLTLLKDYPGKVAIVGFASISEGAATICEIVDVDISSYTIKEEAEVEPMLIKLKKEDYQVIIGDFITVKKAESIGLNGVLLTSGKESVLKAFKNAKKIYDYTKRLKRELVTIDKIAEKEKNGIIIYDKQLKLTYSNTFFNRKIKKFEDMLDLKKSVAEVLEKGTLQSIICIDNEYWKVYGYLVGDSNEVVFRIAECEINYYKNMPGIEVISANEKQSVNITNMSVTTNEKMKNSLMLAEKYLNINEPIWILGEKGTGKEKLARYIHFNGINKDKPYFIIDCNLMLDENWKVIIDNILELNKGIFFEAGTVYLKNIDKLILEIQKQLIYCLLNNKFKCRFIASSDENISKLVEVESFQYELYKLLSKLTLQLPSLSERKDDIENLARMYINEFNINFGKQIVGIREEATELLKNFRWKGNIDQFRQIIKELVLIANEHYINVTDVEKVLANTEVVDEKLNIDLAGSLEEIEQRIIKQIWLEEGMNNTRTAERLKITRTTLWRKLK
ncbi:transcriptional regulator with PAS, ATPase and Fis domain [Clostridium saccharoperbutylacetonicum]|uniref:Transcriptional regulator n=1 Tax=Clostridium saccharoperbutylacetonicum N1-4(HMT) TaxID=931276 RepID=M1MIL8_9CLOT|nr:sigma-54-dependent transcriptional regulator [Clostridium saccharoperbutylacetonicum]AGF57744.1 transcriptional regulator [Clostridium saccharoperbutylacetonicum N1-4(HMT)]NRT61487.1 transcriptional regulator with PAS, ATPase and Fis domain [Clostridium saccharoperbutylacetonicum]NSB24807.1 transcriptional regulator with PAS, ATPase and Fis domain [Clostridium saccharoperbutylacetonicum]NSB44179.1 transcriptional regulator with PAS, ATPase and Fis domain [Clostridium saccharoperbutylacetonic